MNFILFMLRTALWGLSIWAGLALLKYLLFGDGKRTIKEVCKLAGTGILALCIFLRKKIVTKLKKEEEVPLLEENEDPTKVEAHVI